VHAWCTCVEVEGMDRAKGEQLSGDGIQAEYI